MFSLKSQNHKINHITFVFVLMLTSHRRCSLSNNYFDHHFDYHQPTPIITLTATPITTNHHQPQLKPSPITTLFTSPIWPPLTTIITTTLTTASHHQPPLVTISSTFDHYRSDQHCCGILLRH
jgi:hypothetical protein